MAYITLPWTSGGSCSQGIFDMLNHLRDEANNVVQACFQPGFGLRATREGAYGDQIWSRDMSLASMSAAPAYVQQTLETIFAHARDDGVFPHRIEGNRHVGSYCFSWLKRVGIDLVSRPHPVGIYRDSPLAVEALDTLPALIMAFGSMYRQYMAQGQVDLARKLLCSYYPLLKRGLVVDEAYVDKRDGLVVAPEVADWADDIRRSGKTTLINLLFQQAHAEMAILAKEVGDRYFARHAARRARRLRQGIRTKMWNRDGYFQAGVGDERLDTSANVLAGYFWPKFRDFDSVFTQTKEKTGLRSGFLRPFDRGYPPTMLRRQFALAGLGSFANKHAYPWLAQVSVVARMRRAGSLQRSAWEQHRFYAESLIESAWSDFLEISQVHLANGAFYEILRHTDLKPADTRVFGLLTVSKSCRGFLGTAATWLAAMAAFEGQGLNLDQQ